MTGRIGLAVALVIVAALVAWAIERRRRVAPPTQGRVTVPQQLDRQDFPRPDAPWLVVLWTSQHCASCAGLYDKVAPLASEAVAVVELEFPRYRALHERYAIDAAPVTIVVDAQGVTRASFAGAFDAPTVWARVAELRAGR